MPDGDSFVALCLQLTSKDASEGMHSTGLEYSLITEMQNDQQKLQA